MNQPVRLPAQKEIERLRLLGWDDVPADIYGVRQFSKVSEEAISFPSAKYEGDLDSQESKGLWAEFRAKKIIELLRKEKVEVLWEVGAGHGNVAIPLAKVGIETISIEPLYSGARILAAAGFHTYGQTLDQLKLPDSAIQAVGIFDVLEHLENPLELLNEVYRVLAPGGLLITSVPAYQWLFSNFDLQVGHYRRYSRKSLRDLLIEGSFHSIVMYNIFFVFVLPAVLVRRIPFLIGFRSKNNIEVPSSENSLISILDPILRVLLKIEGKISPPWGLSILSISFK